MSAARPSLAVWKFASCDGCQLQLLARERELLLLAERLDVALFLEASSAVREGPYDLSLVEGSISTPHDAERIREVRARSRRLVTIGACATAGGIQALRNHGDAEDFARAVYPHPEYLASLDRSTPIADHVPVDLELPGCPVDGRQLLEVVAAFLSGRAPRLATHSVCVECKRRGAVCVLVAGGEPCLGPVTRAGCGALCPRHDRGCYGCFGPAGTTNAPALAAHLERALGVPRARVRQSLLGFNAWAPEFRGEEPPDDR